MNPELPPAPYATPGGQIAKTTEPPAAKVRGRLWFVRVAGVRVGPKPPKLAILHGSPRWQKTEHPLRGHQPP